VNTDATRAHIDAETMAAWADRALPAEEAAAVELHLSNCDRCQEVLAAFVRSAPVAGGVVIPFWARRPVQWSAAGLAAAAALVAMIWIGRPSSEPAPESTVASRSVVVESPTPISTAIDQLQEKKPSSISAREERRRDQQPRAPQDKADKAAANQAAVGKAVGGIGSAPSTQAVSAPPPVAAPPPPPPAPATIASPPIAVTGTAPVVTPLGATRPGVMYESTARDTSAGIIPAFEIVAPDFPSLASRSVAGTSGGGGGGGVAAKALSQAVGSTRWRVIAGTHVERTVDAGVTWNALPIEPALKTPLLAGVATSPLNCWLVGRGGVVLVTNDGSTFRRVSVPEVVHLTAVTAQDAMRATVTAIDGRKFTTTDGGLTWT